jgi:amino acid adenylation domain-containing protein
MTVDLIAAWASSAAMNVAVTQGERSWSYAELWNAATGLARALRRQGLQRGDVVAIAGARSFGLVSCMTAVLLAGGVMLTVDANLPAERQRLLLREARVKRLLHLGTLQPEDDWMRDMASVALTLVDPEYGTMVGAEHAANDEIELPPIAAADPAYIFFTSGTTGVPKGILGCHKGLNHFLAWQRETFAIGPHDRCAQLTALSFDPLLRDVFLPLTSGATLCLPSKHDELEPASVLSWLAREKVSVLHTVPSRAQSWLADAMPGLEFPHLRLTFFSGEPLTGSLVNRWRALTASEIVNLYGPTETTMIKCCYRVPADVSPGIQPAGVPLPDTQALVLNGDGALCGIGEPGEIVIRTPFRTLGYINSVEEQRKSFVKNPFRDDDSDLLYRTGDRGRYRFDGSLEIGSRLDDQVKINGVRVEPAEVTAVLAQHPAVKACAVIARQDERGENCLAAYLVPADDNAFSVSVVRGYLIRRLPIAMLPAAFVMVQALPLTANGKLDRRALPEPDGDRVMQDAFVAPRSPTEHALALLWSELLKREQIGVHDNFFDLGGHSLLATQVISRVRKTFEADLPLRALFESPTVAGLSELVVQKQAEALSEDELAQLLAEAQGQGSRG